MPHRSRHRVLFAASEVTWFANTGGLADVAASLPPAPVTHDNDWQSGRSPVYLRKLYRNEIASIRTVMTIHEIAYQCMIWHCDMSLTGLDWKMFKHRQLEFYGHLNCLKTGIVYTD